MEQAKKTAAYRVVTDSGGTRIFRFYCDNSGELCCVTKPIQADTEEAALEIAWEQEGKWEVNLCPQCGKYVSSAMFNVNAGLCLDCAPWETEFPAFQTMSYTIDVYRGEQACVRLRAEAHPHLRLRLYLR